MSTIKDTVSACQAEVRKKRKMLQKRLSETSAETPRAEVIQLIVELIDFYWNEDDGAGFLLSGLHKMLLDIGRDHWAWELRRIVERNTTWVIKEPKSRTKSKDATEAAKLAWQKQRQQLSEAGGSDEFFLYGQEVSKRLKELEMENHQLRDTLSQCDEEYFSRLDNMLNDFSETMDQGLYSRIRHELVLLKRSGIARSFVKRTAEEPDALKIDTTIYAGNPGNRRRSQF